MLPPVNNMPVDQEGEIQHTNVRRSGIFDSIQNSVATSPKFMAQESIVKTLGNNFVSQGIMQIGGVLGGILDKITEQGPGPENLEQPRGMGLSDLDRNILKEMLKTLLRIEDNTEHAPPGIARTTAGSEADLARLGDSKVSDGKKSADDILARINQKSPMNPLQRDQHGNIIHDHFADIGQTVTNAASTGLYEAFGYNVLTQGAMDTLGLAGDVGSQLLDKFGSTASNDPRLSVSASAGDTEFEKETLKDSKETKTVLNSMLSRLTEISNHFKKFFGVQEGLTSELEDDFEATKIGAKVPAPALPKELLDRLGQSGPAAGAVPATEGILQQAGDAAEILHTARGVLGGAAAGAAGGAAAKGGVLKKLRHMGKKFLPGKAALGSAALAVAPLAAMAYVADRAGDQTNDIENVEGLKDTSEGMSGFFKKIGLDFSGRFDKARNKSREGLDTTEELESIKRESNADALEKNVDDLKQIEKKKNSLFGETIRQDIANITNINSQTIIPTRYTVRSTETTANRYFDKALN